jgi:type I restriction-modification system DNA methylase subunit
LLIFSDEQRQIWIWPESQNRHGAEVRLTAQRHFVADERNQSLEARLKLLDIRNAGSSATATEILRAVKNAFNADEEAAFTIADLHDALVERNGASTDLEVFLTRLLFIFFGDDTELFAPNGTVHDQIEQLKSDGSETRDYLQSLMQALATPADDRPSDQRFCQIDYVNGGLFSGLSNCPIFDERAQKALLVASSIEWGALSPAIFGAMFQGVLETLENHILNPKLDFKASRDELGAHYTSEPNILKVIEPLFLEELKERFVTDFDDTDALTKLKIELSTLSFLDPACGCGNFLVITYRELRHLEHDIIARLIELGDENINPQDISDQVKVDIDQFFGIEIVESAAQIAKVALWITDHQMNREAADRFGSTRQTVPLRKVPHISRADALEKPWDDVLPAEFCSFVIGNPPFLGSKRRGENANFTSAIASLSLDAIRGIGDLDLVAAWFALATKYMKRQRATRAELDILFDIDEVENVWWKDEVAGIPSRLRTSRETKTALVATNSITQGEQVGILWPALLGQGIEITFAYKSFKWTNDAPGMAAVHCVIVGFKVHKVDEANEKRIFSSFDVYQVASNISPYLLDGPNLTIESHERPLWDAPRMSFGNQPIDGGNFQVTDEEISMLSDSDLEKVSPFVKDYVGSREMLNGTTRKILWLEHSRRKEWSSLQLVKDHLQKVEAFRLESKRKETRGLAAAPWDWAFKTDLGETYLAFPGVSSEGRKYVPISFFTNDTIASNALLVVADASLAHFALLSSSMHNAWIRIVAGRMKSDLRCSASITYNPFPWPKIFDEVRLGESGSEILKARQLTGESLGTSYSKIHDYPELAKSHARNDSLVDELYGYTGTDDDESRFSFLLKLYAEKKGMRI